MVAGTFDILHPGHVYLVEHAAKHGLVTVIVARDSTVLKVKGRPPVVPEEQRKAMVAHLKGVERAVLGHEGEDHLAVVVDLKPDVLVLGPDQDLDPEGVQRELRERGLSVRVVRLTKTCEDYPLCRSRKIKKKIVEIYCGKKESQS